MRTPLAEWHRPGISRYVCCPMILCLMMVFRDGCLPWGSDGPDPPPDPEVCEQPDTDCDCMSYATETNDKNAIYGFNPESYNSNPSEAVGSPSSGTLVSGINLRDEGVGYYHYIGCDVQDTDDWGTQALVWVIEAGGRNYQEAYPGEEFGVGDMSFQHGGQMCWYCDGGGCHIAHQNGRDIDLRYVRTDRARRSLNLATIDSLDYDGTRSVEAMVALILAGNQSCGKNVVKIIVGTKSRITCPNGCGGVEFLIQGDHNDHFHVEIADPD